MSEEPVNDAPEQGEATEFHRAVVQIVAQYVEASVGNKQRLAVLAKAQIVAARTVRRLITRGELFGKPVKFTPAEILELVLEEDAADEKEGTGR